MSIQDFKDKLKSTYPQLKLDLPISKQFSSIEIVDFVIWIESDYDIEIHSYEYTPEILNSPESLYSFIQKKRASV